MTQPNPENTAPTGAVSRVCHLCGSGPKLPHCDAAVHRTTPTRTTRLPAPEVPKSPWSGWKLELHPYAESVVEAESRYQESRRLYREASHLRLEGLRQAREAGIGLDRLAELLGVSKGTVQTMLRRSEGS